MKLSKAQARAIEDAKAKIDKARSFDTWEEYVGETNSFCKGRGGVEYVKENIDKWIWEKEYWENYKEGNVISNAGKNTIEALVKMGIFTVVEYEENRSNGVLDWIHLNDY